jgi:TonB-dependent receptor
MNKTTAPRRRDCVGLSPLPSHGFLLGRHFLAVVAFACAMLTTITHAQTAPGAIEGRVRNSATGDYLNNARVAVKGSARQVFTDAGGAFRLDNLPAGPVTLRVFFTGLDEQEVTVNVSPGQTAVQDLAMTSQTRYGNADTTVKLDAFTVQSTRETNASMIAINEQRFAANITSVVATDEFGTMVDSNPGEFLKYLPGIDVDYFANNITGVSVRGLGANNTELNFDGMTTASMNAEAVGRAFEVQFGTMSDIARAEIRKLPLPQDSANSIGGTINLIRRSAFEYSKRKISYQAVFRSDGEEFTLKQMDGPKDRQVNRWRPNWQVSWTEPISKTFGFSLTLGQEDTIVNTHWSLPRWNLGSAANNTFAAAEIAAGRPVPTDRPSIYNPSMNNPLNHNAPLQQGKDYASLRFDWRPIPELTLGWSLSGTRAWKQVADDIRYVWVGGGNSQFSDRNRTLGQLGAGAARQESPLWRDIYSPATSTVVDARWKKGPWEISAKGALSYSKYQYYDTEHGFFNSTSVAGTTGLVNVPETGVGAGTANPRALTMEFLHDYWGPKEIRAWTTASGAAGATMADYNVPLDWGNLDNSRIGGARARPGVGIEWATASKVFVKRHLPFENPLSLQLGLDWTDRYRNRRYDYHAWTFVGADGIPNTADDSARLMAAESLPRRPDSQYSIPGTERISMSKLYSLYQRNPSWFRYDDERSLLRTLTDGADYDLTEKITAPYLEGDWRLLRNRLRLNGGVRFEKTKATATGLLTDNSAAYMKYANGSTVHLNDRDAAGNLLVRKLTTNANFADYVLINAPTVLPATRSGAPIFNAQIQAAGNALRAAGKTTDTGTNIGRGSILHTQSVYKRKGATNSGGNEAYYPSLHATFNLTENLQLQAGYAKTQGRINFQTALIPNNTITHEIITGDNEDAGALGRITLQNPGLEPWTADNYEARISYYGSRGSVLALGVFQKNVKNFQPTVNTPPMSATDVTRYAAMFPDAGLGPEYEGYSIEYRENAGSARLDGAEIEGRQSLDAFLPAWARGFHASGSLSYLNRIGPNGGELGANRTWMGSARLTYASRKVTARLGYRLNGKIMNNAPTSNGFVGKSYREAQHLLDFNFDIAVHRGTKLFFSANNLTNGLRVDETSYAQRPSWANLGTSHNLGKTFAIGVTGNF